MTDAHEALATIRAGFCLSPERVYLDGNSLGALHNIVRRRVDTVVGEQWGKDLIAGWNDHDWINQPSTVGNRIGQLVGADPGEVLCCDNLSINLFKCLTAALELNAPRTRIITEAGHFPTDNYMAEGVTQLLGPERCQVEAFPVEALSTLDFNDVAALSLSHVNFRSGTLRDLPNITARAQAAGALVIWDLAHSAGVLETALNRHNVDMAVGCTYKFLNGGPGSPGFLYIAKRHQHASNPLPGWMGHADRFAFEPSYRPAPGISRFLTGTQSVIAMAAAEAALSIFESTDIATLRQHSLMLTQYLMDQLANHPVTRDIQCLTPYPAHERGSQVSLRLEEGFPVSQALIDRGVIVDFREPDIIRFGIAPLYNQLSDIDRAVTTLADILKSGIYREERFSKRGTVT
jgi:kynureninase